MKQLGSRELTRWGWAWGDYTGKCRECGDEWWNGDKRATCCERCAMIARYTEAEKKLAELAYLTN